MRRTLRRHARRAGMRLITSMEYIKCRSWMLEHAGGSHALCFTGCKAQTQGDMPLSRAIQLL